MKSPGLAQFLHIWPEYGLTAREGDAVPLTPILGGLSGAQIWHVEFGSQTYALRVTVNTHVTDVPWLEWRHAILAQIQQQANIPICLPLKTLSQKTWLASEGHCYELFPWISGAAVADWHRQPELRRQIVQAIAKWHVVAGLGQFPPEPSGEPNPRDDVKITASTPYGLKLRREMLAHAWIMERQEIEQALTLKLPEFWREYGHHLLGLLATCHLRVSEIVAAAAHLEVPQFPCIRDVRGEHYLFQNQSLAGIVDFAALRVDSPMADLTRLLMEVPLDQAEARAAIWTTYEELRALTTNERQVFIAYDFASRLLTPLNWFRWIVIEARDFGPVDRVQSFAKRALARGRELPELLAYRQPTQTNSVLEFR
ncbi:MAG: phosphotransferase [Pirellulales bacterium]|nr:phosphotransferase [Pirellulales bacterium]